MRSRVVLILIAFIAASLVQRGLAEVNWTGLFSHHHDSHSHGHWHGDHYHDHGHGHHDGESTSDETDHASNSHDHEHAAAPADELDFRDLEFVTLPRERQTPVSAITFASVMRLQNDDSLPLSVSRPPPQSRGSPFGRQNNTVLSITIMQV